MATFDYKKEYKEFYLPKQKPVVVSLPPMQYVAVDGEGDPNQPNGAYANALSLLYGISFTIKMSPKIGREIDGYFAYVVPPLEGLWWMENGADFDFHNKAAFCWTSMIRLPEFVTPEVFRWAQEAFAAKKKINTSAARMLTLEEGLCVQCMHIGSYDDEPATMAQMTGFMEKNGLRADYGARAHHEIYLSDPRRTAPERCKTVIRLPVKRK